MSELDFVTSAFRTRLALAIGSTTYELLWTAVDVIHCRLFIMHCTIPAGP